MVIHTFSDQGLNGRGRAFAMAYVERRNQDIKLPVQSSQRIGINVAIFQPSLDMFGRTASQGCCVLGGRNRNVGGHDRHQDVILLFYEFDLLPPKRRIGQIV